MIYLGRHGETDWNARGLLQGRTDIPLNARGKAQAHDLARRLEGSGITSITTSDLARAAETGAIVAAALRVTELHVEPDLVERSFGPFEGLSREACAVRYPEAWRAWTEQTIAPEGAESRTDVVQRMHRALERVLARTAGRSALVISHGGAMRLWLLESLPAPVPPIANGALYRVEHHVTGFRPSLWEP